jgi:hypothetical protein
MAVPSAAQRDTRLDQLATAVDDWATQRLSYINNQAAFLQRVLKNRAGAQSLNSSIGTQATALSVDTLTQFLTGQ